MQQVHQIICVCYLYCLCISVPTFYQTHVSTQGGFYARAKDEVEAICKVIGYSSGPMLISGSLVNPSKSHNGL
jgi:hypothetical protein